MFDAVHDEWRQVVLSDVVEIVTAGISADELALKPEVHHYSLPAFDLGRGPDVGPGDAIKSNKTFVPRDCILFSKLNPHIPRVWRVEGIASPDSYCSTEFWPLVRKSAEVDLDFLTYFLSSPAFLSDPAIVPSSSTNSHQRVDRRSFESFTLTLPPLDEQQRIAEVLRSVDEAMTAAQAVVVQARQVLDGHLSALMRSGISAGDERALDALPEGWSEGRCDTYFVLQRGFDITESQAVAGPFRVISSSGPSYSHSEAAVGGPAVITGRKGRLGTVFYSADPCWPHDTTLWVRDFRGNDPRFIYWKLRDMRLDAYDAATSVPTLNRNNVHALTVRFPPLGEQGEIAKILDAEEEAIARSAAAIDAIAKAKEVLVSDLLSGRVRVPA